MSPQYRIAAVCGGMKIPIQDFSTLEEAEAFARKMQASTSVDAPHRYELFVLEEETS